jgi:hypothetical protein
MELMVARQVSEMTGVPLGTLRYWRHTTLGRPVSLSGGASSTTAMRFCAGSQNRKRRREEGVVTRRDQSPSSERPRGLMGVDQRGVDRFELLTAGR